MQNQSKCELGWIGQVNTAVSSIAAGTDSLPSFTFDVEKKVTRNDISPWVLGSVSIEGT